jgi:ATP-binding protein involved in chromosome partitioning
LLGSLPLDIAIRTGADSGRPTVVSAADSPAAHSYRDIARKVAAHLSIQARDYSARFPEIVIENN